MVAPPLLMNQNQNAPDDFPLARPLDGLGGLFGPYSYADTPSDMQWSLAAFAARRPSYALYGAYLDGDHRAVVATQAYETAFRDLLGRARANLCPAVVRAFADRLKIAGFTPHGDTTDETGASDAWQFWQDHRLARVANWAHGRAIALGDAYLHVWPDAQGRAQVYAHDGTAFVARYDEETPGIPALAARLWLEDAYTSPDSDQDGPRYRLTLFYPDRIEKYRTGPNTAGLPTKADAFAPYQPPGDTRWPVPNPWGRIPVFPLPFEGGPGRPGRSVLAEVVPLQDQLNKAVIDRAVAMEFGAWPQRWAVGLEPQQAVDSDGAPRFDANGQPIWAPLPFRLGIDRLLTVANIEAKFGQFDATNLTPYTETIMSFLDLISAATGIPPHLLHRGMGTPPSGEALKTAEARLVARVEDTQTDFGDVWEDAIGFALAIDGVGPTAMLHVVADWRPAVTRAEKEHAETVGILVTQAGVPEAAAWKLLDFTDDQIRAMQAEKRREQAFAADLVAGDGSATLRAELGEEEGE